MRITPGIILQWLIAMLLVVRPAIGQEDLSTYRIQHFTDDNGLPQNSVKAIMEDQNGFIWLSTEAGLVRFDGHRFVTFDRSDLPISSNRIRGFVPAVTNFSARRPYGFYALSEGNEYIGIRNNGRVSVDTAFYHNYQKINPFSRNEIRHNSIAVSLPAQYAVNPAGEHYFAASDPEKFYIWRKNTITCYQQGKAVFKSEAPFRSFFLIGSKPFAMDSAGSFLEICRDRKQKDIWPEGDITGNPQFARGRDNLKLYWNNISRKAFVYLNQHFYTLEIALNGGLTTRLILKDFDFDNLNIVTAHYDEKQGFLFLGSVTKGLFLIKKKEFQTLKLQRSDADNVYYAQTPGRGRSVLTSQGYQLGIDPDGNHLKAKRVSAFMENFRYKFSMAVNKDSSFWFGIGFELYKLDKTGQKILTRITMPEKLKSLFVDEAGRLWIGCERDALYRLDPSDETYKPRLMYRAKIGGITVMGQETPEVLFIGTDAGLYRLNIGNGRFQVIKNFENMNVRSFYTTGDGTWITTYGNGIYLLNQNKLVKFPLDNDRFLATAHCIVEDKKGFFWITTNRGLFQVAKRQLLDYAANDRNLVYYLYYDQTHGFETNEFNGGCNPCSVTLADGTVSFPSMDGLVWYSPAKIEAELPGRGIFISSVREDGKDKPIRDTLEISRDFEQLRVQVTTPYLGHANNIQMHYTLSGEGRAEKWIPVNEDLSIPVSKIPHGNYRLTIRKISGFGTNDYIYKVIRLHIPPAWFETWWFRSLLALVLIALFFLAVRWRTGYLLKKERENNLMRHYRLISQIVAAVNHDIQTPLHYIGFSLQQINSYLHKQQSGNPLIVRMSDESLNTSKRLGVLTKNLLDYIKLQNKKESSRTHMGIIAVSELVAGITELFSAIGTFREITIQNRIDPVMEVYSDRNLLSIVIHNLIDNALKNSKSEVSISNGFEKGRKQITIRDDGEGMPEDLIKWLNENYKSYEEWLRASQRPDQKGIGLVIVKDLCVLLHIGIEVRVTDGRQTVITLFFDPPIV